MVEEHIYKLRKLLEELEIIKGRHTELVSVYIPSGFNLQEIINMLRQEYTLTENVKNKTVRNNVLGAIDKILSELKLFKKTPKNGLVLFAGNVSESEGQTDIKLWSIEPPEPLRIKKYWCDKKFELEPLQEMIAEKEVYGLVVLDNKGASIGLLKGKKIEILREISSIVPGKFRKGGQCLSPETLVFLSDGNITKIKDVKENSLLKSADFNIFSFVDSQILDFWQTKKSEIYKIITKYPRIEIETSKDHVFFVFKNECITEKSAKELKIGDILLMPEKINVNGKQQFLNNDYYFSFRIIYDGLKFLKKKRKKKNLSQKKLADLLWVWQGTISAIERGKRNFSHKGLMFLEKICKVLDINFKEFKNKYIIPKSKVKLPKLLTKNLAQIIGYFIGDGNYDKNRITFSDGKKALIRFYKNKIKNTFNINANFRYRRSKGYYELRIYSKSIEKFLRGEFLESKHSATSLIPKKILNAEDKILAAFLKGFFDADGYISKDRVAIGINNKILAQQIQLSLLRFGIISSLLEYNNRRNPYSKKYRYTIEIGEKESLVRFKSKIGFSTNNEMLKLQKTINRASDSSRIRRILPIGKKLFKLVKNYNMNTSDFPKVSNFFQNKRFMSKTIFKRSLLSEVKNEELYSQLLWLLDCRLLPVIISKIIKIIRAIPMIDITVKNQNFIANGVLVHNSAQRFQRVREGLINDWYKKIAQNAKEYFSKVPNIRGIIIGGPGPAKNDFLDGDYLLTEIKKQVLGIKNTGYTNEQGLEELVQRSQDILAEAAVAKEKALVQKFFEELRKESGLAIYGKEKILKVLEMGAVDIIMISEGLESKEITEKAKDFGTKVEIISKDTREGEQLYQLGGTAAILRWKIN